MAYRRRSGTRRRTAEYSRKPARSRSRTRSRSGYSRSRVPARARRRSSPRRSGGQTLRLVIEHAAPMNEVARPAGAGEVTKPKRAKF